MPDPRHVVQLREVVFRVRAAGVQVREVTGWEDRGSGPMKVVAGMVQHHTAGGASGDAPSLRVVTFGREGLRNSLSMWYVSRSGVVYLVAAGVSWHAGNSTWNGVSALNDKFAGTEGESTGSPDEQWSEGSLRAQAVVTRTMAAVFGFTARDVAEHREVAVPAGRKPDRVNIDGSAWRERIAAGGPTVDDDEDDDMRTELKRGDTGRQVIEWLAMLKRACQLRGVDLEGLDVDGAIAAATFDGAAEAAANRYRKALGAPESGVFDYSIYVPALDDVTRPAPARQPDTSGLVTRDEYRVHRHAEGTTGPPR